MTFALPVVIGVAFGWTLERAGLGSARKLIGQFYLRDLAVFKVMFSALVTAMLGLFWLERLGVVGIGSVYVPETFVAPQALGGVLFGVGFVVSGLCPGTSCVAAATGRLDGLATVFGMFAGVLVTGLILPSIWSFYGSTARGATTLPDALRLPQGAVVFAIVMMAIVGFQIAERLERRA